MRLVIDANILFSALIRDGLTRRLLLHPEVSSIAPEFIAKEFNKHENELKVKAGLDEDSFARAAALLFREMRLISDESLIPYLPAASSLTADKKDVIYLAAALSSDADIWSNDGGFRHQARVNIWTTDRLRAHLGI